MEVLGVKNQRQVARILGISDASVSGWKRQGFISIEMLLRIAELTNASINYLLTGRGPKFLPEESGRPIEEIELAAIQRYLIEQVGILDKVRRQAKTETKPKSKQKQKRAG